MKTLRPTNKLLEYSDIFYQNIISEECMMDITNALKGVEYLYTNGTVYKQGVGDVVDDNIKVTNEIFLDEYMHLPEIKHLYHLIESNVITFVNNIRNADTVLGLQLKTKPLYNGKFRLKKYDKGVGKYDWHTDDGGDWSKRILTIIVYLDDVKDGGVTEFSNQQCSLPSKKGVMCAFPPYWNYPHRSTPNTSSDKTIIALFIEEL